MKSTWIAGRRAITRRAIIGRAIIGCAVMAYAVIGAACISVRVPPREVTCEWGTVHADDDATARTVAHDLDRVAPLVARSLPGLTVSPVDLRVVSRISDVIPGHLPDSVSGGSLELAGERWIEIRADVAVASRSRTIAHELVHAWLGPDWATLPPVMEDGLCEEIAEALGVQASSAERLQRFFLTWLCFDGSLWFDQRALPITESIGLGWVQVKCGLDRVDLARFLESLEMDQNRFIAAYEDGTGYAMRSLAQIVVSRMTLDRLHELCLRAKSEGLDLVPAEWLLEAAHLDAHDSTAWRRAIRALYGDVERAELLRTVRAPWRLPLPHGSLAQ